MKVKITIEATVPDDTESGYTAPDQSEAIAAEVAEKIAPFVQGWICQELVRQEKHHEVRVDFKQFYPHIYNIKK